MTRQLPELALDLPATVAVGENVRITLHVTHPGPDALEISLRGRSATFDVEVSDADGHVVWRRLDGAMIPGIVQLRVLWPGERFDLHASWDQRDASDRAVPAGDYRVRAMLLTDALEPPATEARTLRIG